jgi:hypothetical protein
MHLEISIEPLTQLLMVQESLRWFLVSSIGSYLLLHLPFILVPQLLLNFYSSIPVLVLKSVPDGAEPVELDVHDFKGPGVALAMYNVDEV